MLNQLQKTSLPVSKPLIQRLEIVPVDHLLDFLVGKLKRTQVAAVKQKIHIPRIIVAVIAFTVFAGRHKAACLKIM